jgi:hypothetical protein
MGQFKRMLLTTMKLCFDNKDLVLVFRFLAPIQDPRGLKVLQLMPCTRVMYKDEYFDWYTDSGDVQILNRRIRLWFNRLSSVDYNPGEPITCCVCREATPFTLCCERCDAVLCSACGEKLPSPKKCPLCRQKFRTRVCEVRQLL